MIPAMPRYVILRHDWPAPHLDLLVEAGEVLKAWRLPPEPPPGEWVPAAPNADHRRLYLEYEGPVAGDRGSVVRWLAGEWGDGVVEFRGDGWCRVNPLPWAPARQTTPPARSETPTPR